jgi:hypothetical protein
MNCKAKQCYGPRSFLWSIDFLTAQTKPVRNTGRRLIYLDISYGSGLLKITDGAKEVDRFTFQPFAVAYSALGRYDFVVPLSFKFKRERLFRRDKGAAAHEHI